MSAVWSIKRESTTRTLADWGVVECQVEYYNQAADTLRLVIPVTAVGGASGWARDQALELLRDGVAVWRGIVENDPEQEVHNGEEALVIRGVGPWWYLEHIVMTAAWAVYDIEEEETVAGRTTRVILGQSDAGVRQHAGEVIQTAIAQASAEGTRFVAGTIDVTTPIPLDEAVDVTCAEAILKVLRWTPDAVAWFDYAASPPALHIRRAASLPLVTYAAGDASPVRGWTSRPRGDLQVAGVVLKYESTHTDSEGNERHIIQEEAAPVDAAEGNPRVLVLTIPLQGVSSSVQSARITTAEIPADLNTAYGWWKARVPVLSGVADEDITIDVTRSYPTRIYELLHGSIPEWLDSVANVANDEIAGTLRYKKNGRTFEVTVGHKMTVCSLQSGLRKHVTREGGETAPTGLAAAYYAAAGSLYYDGQVHLEYDDLPAGPWLGRRVQPPTGGAGIVQHVELDMVTGAARVAFGPPEHLGPQDMIAFLRANRGRATSRNNGRRTESAAGAGRPEISTGGPTPVQNTVPAPAGQLTEGEISPAAGLVVPAPLLPYQTLTAVTSAEDASVVHHTFCILFSLALPLTTFSRISLAVAVQINGFGSLLCTLMYSSIARVSSSTFLNTPLLTLFTVKSRKNRSTMFSQEALVGVK